MFVHLEIFGFQTSCAIIGSKTSGRSSDSRSLVAVQESVELLPDSSLALASFLKLLEGPSCLASVTIPDLDAAGRKAPVRTRCKSISTFCRGSASISVPEPKELFLILPKQVRLEAWKELVFALDKLLCGS